jgi:putative protease
MNKRDPNQGTCTNACRWEYKTEAAKEDENGQIVEANPTGVAIQEVETQDIEVQDERPDNTLGLGKPTDEVVLLSESHKPEEKMAAFEDEHGTYIMNSKDLRAIQHVERLTKMGVHSLKIEGRTKSFYYCARTAQVYRKAIDDAVAGKPFDESLMGTLESLAHRGYTEGFLRRHTHDTYQNYEYGYSISDTQQFVGEFTGKRRGDLAEVEVKNKFLLGDSLEMMTPKGNVVFKLEVMENRKSEAVDDAKGNGHFVFIPVPTDLDLQYGLLMRNLNKGQDTRNASGK